MITCAALTRLCTIAVLKTLTFYRYTERTFGSGSRLSIFWLAREREMRQQIRKRLHHKEKQNKIPRYVFTIRLAGLPQFIQVYLGRILKIIARGCQGLAVCPSPPFELFLNLCDRQLFVFGKTAYKIPSHPMHSLSNCFSKCPLKFLHDPLLFYTL